MNIVVIGIFSNSVIGIEGSVLQSLSHGLVSSGLFACIGFVYERYKTRLVKYYGGISHIMPIYVSTFLFFTMANIGFPGTSGFLGEFLILAGAFNVNIIATFLSATSIMLGSCYSLWLLNRISFGNLKTQHLKNSFDLNQREMFVLLPLAFYTLMLGLLPNTLLIYIHSNVTTIVEKLF